MINDSPKKVIDNFLMIFEFPKKIYMDPMKYSTTSVMINLWKYEIIWLLSIHLEYENSSIKIFIEQKDL